MSWVAINYIAVCLINNILIILAIESLQGFFLLMRV